MVGDGFSVKNPKNNLQQFKQQKRGNNAFMIQTCVFLCDWLCRELAGLLLLTSGLIFHQILLHQKKTNLLWDGNKSCSRMKQMLDQRETNSISEGSKCRITAEANPILQRWNKSGFRKYLHSATLKHTLYLSLANPAWLWNSLFLEVRIKKGLRAVYLSLWLYFSHCIYNALYN